MSELVSLKDVVSLPEAVEFLEGLLTQHGDTEDAMMILLLKVSLTKAILEKALGADPIIVTLEDVE
jgi:hypothetical protein